MGGRGSMGGTRSTYRGESTRLFRERIQGNDSSGGSGGGGGGGGGSKTSGTGGSGTGGIQTGGGGGQGGGGGSITEEKTTTTTETTDINKQELPPDANLKDLFEESDIFDELITKYPEDNKFKSNYSRYYQRWLQSEGLVETPGDGDEGGGTGPTDPEPDPIEANIHADVPEDKAEEINNQVDELPERLRRVLTERGVSLEVGRRADQTDGWASYAAATGKVSTDTTQDGRELGTLSFYNTLTKQVFISTDHPGGSANVMVHEMGHALDYTWNKDSVLVTRERNGINVQHTVKYISRDDPDWIEMHDNHLLPVKGVDSWFDYFIGGPSGTNDAAGRAELFAEGLAQYLNGNPAEGKIRLRAFLFTAISEQTSRYHVADKMIEIWKRYGIIE